MILKVVVIHIDYTDYDILPFDNTTVTYSVLEPENPKITIPNVILNPSKSEICLSSTVCANLTTDCIYFPSSLTNVTVNQTHFIDNFQLKNNMSLPNVLLDCTVTNDLSQDILNYSPALHSLQQKVTKCCHKKVLLSPPVVNEKDETKFKEKSGSHLHYHTASLLCLLFLILQ